MTEVPFGRVVSLVRSRADGRQFRLGLDAIESGTGRLADDPNTDYAGEGIAFEKGDVLFGKLRPYLAKVWVADRPGAAVGDFHVYRPCAGVLVAPYLRYLLLARNFLAPVVSSVFGARMPRADWDFIRNVPVYVPALESQGAIVSYLDRETSKIDTLIAEQRGLVEVLRERRAALIMRAVTLGLSRAPLKASSLSWVDAVPEHWVVANLRRFAQMKTGHTPSRSNPEFWVDCDIPWFTLADVWQLRDGKRTYLGDTETSISELGLANSAAELLPAGTVVLSRTASVGFSGIMPRPMATSQDFWNWVCGPRLLPEYLLWVFRAMRDELNALMTGSTHKTIYQPVAAAIRIPVPPVSEQREIADYLSEQTEQIDALIAEAEGIVTVAKERRSALITAAVTGQIDVRGEVA